MISMIRHWIIWIWGSYFQHTLLLLHQNHQNSKSFPKPRPLIHSTWSTPWFKLPVDRPDRHGSTTHRGSPRRSLWMAEKPRMAEWIHRTVSVPSLSVKILDSDLIWLDMTFGICSDFLILFIFV
jgi:hypothetical protein